MAGSFYTGNTVDTTTKDVLTKTLLNKIVKQIVETKVFEGPFNVFNKDVISGTGFQAEEWEIGNITATDFDEHGLDALNKADMDFKVLYHHINRKATYHATVSDKQMKIAMLNEANLREGASHIVAELSNSAAIDDFENMKTLLNDIVIANKSMTVCDLNGNGAKADAFIKAIQVLADNMALPSTEYNFSGFKKEFNKKEDLVLIIDSAMKARLNVDSLAGAFNMDKKALVNNIVVIDKFPATMKFNAENANAGVELAIGESTPCKMYKPASGGAGKINGDVLAILCNKKAIYKDPVVREVEDQRNAAGRFTNYFLYAEDLLSYSTLKNAVAIVD